ncbi:TetR family transcriptional regulator [Microbacterium sp.]|jgi:AcrR family transcriptional regulator|uniref:TetR/AcrR family transcriptional regulator n=1 Tax=Microbacterium sp. TaxID=51671 RepID=UPI0037C65364
MGGERGRSKAAIKHAAASLFTDNGYAATSIRDIARQAGADPALVIRHYGSKEKLFLDAMQIPPEWALRFELPLETLGERLVRYVMDTEHEVRGVYLALVRASDAGDVASALHLAHDRTFVEPLRAILTGPDADLRARLVAAAVGGLMSTLWLVRDTALLDADPEALIRTYATAIQQLVTPAASKTAGEAD